MMRLKAPIMLLLTLLLSLRYKMHLLVPFVLLPPPTVRLPRLTLQRPWLFFVVRQWLPGGLFSYFVPGEQHFIPSTSCSVLQGFH